MLCLIFYNPNDNNEAVDLYNYTDMQQSKIDF